MKEGSPEETTAETRKLAAIMFTDMVGFSRQMGIDETCTLRLLEVYNRAHLTGCPDVFQLALTTSSAKPRARVALSTFSLFTRLS